MFNINDFNPMFNQYNRLYGTNLRYSSPKRDSLLEKCCEVASVEEITEAVLREGKIDITLENIIKNGKVVLAPKTPSLFDEVKETKSEVETMTNTNNLGNELQNVLMQTIAQFSAEKLINEVMPQIKQKVVDEFGVLPVKHEITVNGSNPVTIEADLPPVFDEILDSASCGVNVMMTGPAGTGKGFMARQVAKALEAEFYEVNAVDTEYGLTGFVDANSRYNPTPFYDACKASSEGKKVIFLFDEMDCSNSRALKVFNEALEAGEFTFPNNEKLNFEDMVFMSACNTYGTGSDEMYVGNRIDESTLNRFVMIKVDYNRKVEERLAEGDEQLCDFIDGFRSQIEKCGLQTVISYRNIKQIKKLMKTTMALKRIMQIALVKSIADDDLRNILSNMSYMSENIYYRATKGENVKVA